MEKETRHCQVYQEILKIFFRERHTLKAKFNMVQYSLSNHARGYVVHASVKDLVSWKNLFIFVLVDADIK